VVVLTESVRDVTGFILAGGESRRLGRDKRILRIGGQTLLARTQGLLRSFLDEEPFVVGDNLVGLGIDPDRIILDARPDCGPLGGLVASLEKSPTEWVLILAVDMPFLEKADLQRMLQAARQQYDVLTLSTDGRPEPLAALYRRTALPFWRERLNKGILSLSEGIEQLKWQSVLVKDDSRALLNINDSKDVSNLT
jgi:molybdopterin-guanine dinucleotide biosynthesis protein A